MKKFLAILAVALMVLTCTVAAFAATEPKLTNDLKTYVSFSTGNNEYSGLSADEPKKQLLTLEDSGVVSLLKDGGTMVAVGKLFIGGDYSLPELGSTLLITSNDGTKDYKNSFPIENPSCAMKMQKKATLTLSSDVIIDDIILFQEHNVGNAPKFHVTNNSTLMMGSKIETTTNINFDEAPYYEIEVDKGSAVILNGGTYQIVTGEGEVVVNGAKILEGPYATEAAAKPVETVVVTTAAAPAATEAPVAATEDASAETTAAAEETGVETTAAEATEEVAAPETTEAAAETDKEAAPATTAADAETETTGASEGGVNVALIIGIVAAVVVVAAAAILVAVKKKKK